MIVTTRKNEAGGSNVLKKISVEGKVDGGQEVIVRPATASLECKGFKSFMVLWGKVYERV